MKKIVSTFAFALLVGGLTFAEDVKPAVTIGAWGRAFFVPVVTGNDDNMTQNAVSWGSDPRVGITISGTSESVGFQLDIDGNDGDIAGGDQQKIWVKPFEGVTFTVGKFYDDTLRGNGTFGSFDWLRISGTGEDLTFTRVGNGSGAPGKGAEVSYSNGGIYVFGATGQLDDPITTEAFTKTLQIGGGYTIADIGQIRAQAIGHNETATTDAYQEIQAAFKLTSVQNLYLDVGANFPTDKDAAGYQFKAAVYANYTMDKAKIHGLFSYYSPTDSDLDAGLEAGAGLDYGLEGGLGLSADFRYQNNAQVGAPNDDGRTGFFAGVTKGFSNGLIGIGIEYSSTKFASIGGDVDAAHIALPIRAEY